MSLVPLLERDIRYIVQRYLSLAYYDEQVGYELAPADLIHGHEIWSELFESHDSPDIFTRSVTWNIYTRQIKSTTACAQKIAKSATKVDKNKCQKEK